MPDIEKLRDFIGKKRVRSVSMTDARRQFYCAIGVVIILAAAALATGGFKNFALRLASNAGASVQADGTKLK